MGDNDREDAQIRPALVLAPGEGRPVSLGAAGEVILKAVSSDTGGTLAVYEFTVPPATAGPPLHIHRNWDEGFYVLEGEMAFLIDGQTSTAPAGAFVFIPRGVPHTFWNKSAAPARQLTVFTPAGIEDYFDDVTQVMTAGGEDTLETATALMEKHDMVVPASSRAAYGALTSPQNPPR